MSVGIGSEATQFHLWEYINRILSTVYTVHVNDKCWVSLIIVIYFLAGNGVLATFV